MGIYGSLIRRVWDVQIDVVFQTPEAGDGDGSNRATRGTRR